MTMHSHPRPHPVPVPAPAHSAAGPAPDTSAAAPRQPRTHGMATAHDLFPAVVAGLVAVLISYAGPLLLVLQAAQAGHLSAAQLTSWVWAISIGAGVCGVWMSWRQRVPVVCAWNTPGAALLASALVALPYSQVIGAYLVAAAALLLIGWTGVFDRLMARIPRSLCAAMLAGILLRFGVDAFGAARSTVEGAPWLVGAMFAGYLLFKQRSARYAIALTLLLGVALWQWLGWGQVATPPAASALGASPSAWGLALPVWTTPELSWPALLSTAVPLALLCLTGQQVPGVAVLRASGYTAHNNQLIAGTGLASLLLAPFGAHGINLAAITAAICTGEEAHPLPEKRWVAGVACGLFYLLLGSFAGAITFAFAQLPAALVSTVAGLALLGAIQNGLIGALAEPSEREAALVTFVVTASNVSLLGLGSACWGLALGLLSWWMLKPRAAIR
ncbi:benzoate/H(+) symporter BenE family transporter [Acidovorax sp. FJL06]|uniref:benzoate/H(+) symporter BenE family transporter n=1 Tax=Acidovorax sp. FJL06 TaxID=2153365 RepID=UPI000F579518|nr:benzoate/H(+) symporter BenE family transporter [Acidovorax sp. FJL06]RQO79265.1 benzoate transporter [Acidovorax sp. FJL06]